MMKKNILFFFMVGLLFLNFLIPVSVSGMSEKQVKADGKKGDIYNPQTNSIGDSALVNAFHYADGQTYSNGDVEVQKIVRKTNTEGRYHVEFKIRGKNAKEGVVTIHPVYVVVVLDRSNSMRHDSKWTNAIAGAKSFATTLFQSIPTAQLALVEFSGKTDNTNWSDAEVIRDFENKNFDSTDFGSYGKNGGATNLGEGLRYAYHLLNGSNVPDDAYKYVVVLSDGEPTLYTDSDGDSDGDAYNYDKTAHEYATTWATNLKTTLGAQIFTIGYEITSGGKAETVLKGIADASSYYVDADTSDIVSKFKNVSSSFDVEYNAGSSVTIVDQLGSAFTLVDGSTTLTLDTIVESWTSLGSFDITIDPDSSNGWYPTNDGFLVTYQDHKGVLKEFSCEDDPEVLWEQDEYEYTVRYHFNHHLDPSFTQILSGVFQDIVYAKDYYLEYINSNGLSDKNQADQTEYFLDPDNDSNFSDMTVSSNPDDNVLDLYYVDTHFENESISKSTDVEVIDEKGMVVPYVVDYHVDVAHVREGDRIVTIITDQLPYQIDVEKSYLNGGSYDPENQTVTWTFEDQVDTYHEVYPISKQIAYGVVYLDFVDVSVAEDHELINYVSGYTKVNDKVSNGVEDDAVTSMFMGTVIVHYVTKDGDELTDPIVMTGVSGSAYETIKKEFDDYYFIELIGEVSGVFSNDVLEVTYIYDTVPLPPHTGLNDLSFASNIKYIFYFCIFTIFMLVVRTWIVLRK